MTKNQKSGNELLLTQIALLQAPHRLIRINIPIPTEMPMQPLSSTTPFCSRYP